MLLTMEKPRKCEADALRTCTSVSPINVTRIHRLCVLKLFRDDKVGIKNNCRFAKRQIQFWHKLSVYLIVFGQWSPRVRWISLEYRGYTRWSNKDRIIIGFDISLVSTVDLEHDWGGHYYPQRTTWVRWNDQIKWILYRERSPLCSPITE